MNRAYQKLTKVENFVTEPLDLSLFSIVFLETIGIFSPIGCLIPSGVEEGGGEMYETLGGV